MKEIIETALNTFEGKNIEYGEIRIVERMSQGIVIRNGAIESLVEEMDKGFGIRVFKNGGMGFASSTILTKDSVYNTVILAIRIAEASSRLSKGKVILSEEKVLKDIYKTPYKKDPFEIPIEKKLSILFQIDEILRKKPEIVLTMLQMNFFKTKKYFASTEGHYIEQEIIESGGGYTAYAFKDGELQQRSYPASHGGNYPTEGWEFIENMK
ncbi:MAG: DNA gyrase modulator, partial [candidate division WOR-3 bacterium]